MAQKISQEDIEIIIENSELLDLVTSGFLKSAYPFVINPNSSLFAELNFYQIKAGQKVAEIGAGKGIFSLLVAMVGMGLQIYVNELDIEQVEYIISKKYKYSHLLDTSKIVVVQGTKSQTNLEVNQFDKIIIRNSFHHFSKKSKMMASIKLALKEKAELYLYEPFIDHDNINQGCRKILKKQKLLKIISNNGFIVQDEKLFGEHDLLLRLIKK